MMRAVAIAAMSPPNASPAGNPRSTTSPVHAPRRATTKLLYSLQVGLLRWDWFNAEKRAPPHTACSRPGAVLFPKAASVPVRL